MLLPLLRSPPAPRSIIREDRVSERRHIDSPQRILERILGGLWTCRADREREERICYSPLSSGIFPSNTSIFPFLCALPVYEYWHGTLLPTCIGVMAWYALLITVISLYAPSCMHMNLVYSNGTKNRQKLAVPNRAIEVSNVIHFGRTKLGNNGGPLRKQASQSAWFTASMSHSSFAPDIYKGSLNRRKWIDRS